MKKDIHPTYHQKASIACACGNSFETGSTVEKMDVELCSKCHPFYTGTQKIVDTARRVEKFQTRAAKKSEVATGKKAKRAKRAAAKKSETKEQAEA